MRRKQEPDKARDSRRGTCHHVSARGVHQLAKGHVLVAHPGCYHVDGGIDTDTKRHRNHDNVVYTDFPELEQVGKDTQKSKRQERSHSKGDAARRKQLGFPERNHERTENNQDYHESKPEAILLHGLDDIGKDELRRERAQVLAVEIPVAVAILEVMKRLRIPTREIAVDKANLSVAAVLFTEQVERPFGNILGRKRLLDGGQVPEVRDICGILPFGTVKHASFDQVSDFLDNFEAPFLGIQRRHERLQGEETPERRILFHMQTHHQGIVKHVELFGLASHDGRRSRSGPVVRTRHARVDAVFLFLFRRDTTQVAQVVFKVHILGKPERNGTERKACKSRVLEKATDFILVPGLGQQRVIGRLRDPPHALDKDRKHEHRGKHTEQYAHRRHHAELVEAAEVCRKQSEERGDSRETCKEERLEHLPLGRFQDFFQSRMLVQQLLRSAQNVNRVVDADAQNDGGDKHRERIQLSVEEGSKRKRREAGVQHRSSHQNRALHAPEEENREEDDEHQADAEREDGIVRHVIHFLEAFVSPFHRKARRHGICLGVEISKQGIGPRENARHELVIGRGPEKFRVHHAVEENLSGTVRTRATDKARLQVCRDRLFLVPFLGFGRLVVLLCGFFLALLEKRIERAHRLVGKSQFLRQVRIEPHAFLLGGRRRCRSACRIGSGSIAQQIDDQGAVLAPYFELQVFEVVADVFEMLDRQVEERIVLEKLVVVVHLRRDVVALPVLADVIADGILQSGDQFHVLALDGNHEAVGRSETLVRFFKSLHARRIFGKQVREVRIEFEPRLYENRERTEDGEQQVEGQRLVLVGTNQGYVPVRKSFNQGFLFVHFFTYATVSF